jgi:hypothetical protein
VNLDIGNELRRVRLAQKLSLRNVASAVGVSASLLSQVETGKTQPSVSTLYALVNHLGISLDGLMRGQQSDKAQKAPAQGYKAGDDSIVRRRSDNPVIEMENGVLWERLADGGSDVADPLMVTYAPGSSSSVEGKLMRHAAIEYGVIIEGTLTLRVEWETYELFPGDSFSFDAGRPHLYENKSSKPARGIWFVIGTKDVVYQNLSDLGHSNGLTPQREAKSAVDVLKLMEDAKNVKLGRVRSADQEVN